MQNPNPNDDDDENENKNKTLSSSTRTKLSPPRLRRSTTSETPSAVPIIANESSLTTRRSSVMPAIAPVSEPILFSRKPRKKDALHPSSSSSSTGQSSLVHKCHQTTAEKNSDAGQTCSGSSCSGNGCSGNGCNASVLFGETRDIQSSRSYRKWKSMKARDLRKFFKDHPQTFYRRLRRGIPQRFRWEAWRELVHLNEILAESGCEWALRLRPPHDEACSAVSEPDILSLTELKALAKDKTPIELYEELAERPSKFTSLVDIDVARTFPEISAFDKSVQKKLHRVLNAYANFAPNVGYCQGMNFVAGFIILVSSCAPEPEVFWFFANLMSSQNVHGFFREHFPLLGSFINAFDQLADHYIPEIRRHFLRENIQPPVYLHQWYLTLFVTSLPLGTVVVVWDSFLCNGLQSILPLTLALLKVLQSFILRLKFEGIVKFLKSLRSSGDCDESKIGRMLVRQAENYPLLPIVYPLVVDIDWEVLLKEAETKRQTNSREKEILCRTESLVDFEQPLTSNDGHSKTNPLNVAIGDELNSDDEEDHDDDDHHHHHQQHDEGGGIILSSSADNAAGFASSSPLEEEEEDKKLSAKKKGRTSGRKNNGMAQPSSKGFFPKFMGRKKPD